MKRKLATIMILMLVAMGNIAITGNINTEKESNAIYSVEEINFVNELGTKLSGTLFKSKESKIAIVFAHSFVPGQDQSGLFPLARELAELGITSLTFDFPGYGKTEGPPKYDKVDVDVKSAIDLLRGLGYSKIASMGVGLGGFGSAKNARNLVGLITISIPTGVWPDLFLEKEDFNTPYPKLFISARDDFANNRPFADYAQQLYDLSVEPRKLKIFSGRYHSMALFKSEHGKELKDLIIEFFKTINEKY